MKKKRTVKANPRRVQDTDIAIGERIKARRNLIEMSQKLGDALKVSFQQVQKYENGTNRISSGRLLQLAEALQCGVTDLIGDTDTGSRHSLAMRPQRRA